MAQNGARRETAWLLIALAVGCSHTEAARRAGCERRTVARRLKDPVFQARLVKAKDKLLARATARASASMIATVATIHKLLKSEDPGIQLRAADLLLNHASKLREACETAARLAAIEVKLDQARPQPKPGGDGNG